MTWSKSSPSQDDLEWPERPARLLELGRDGVERGNDRVSPPVPVGISGVVVVYVVSVVVAADI